MIHLRKLLEHKRPAPTLVLITVVLPTSWMGYANGAYFIGEWGPVAILLAALALITSVTGVFSGMESRWSAAALGLFAAYAAWTLASILWSPNRGDAWLGAGQTLLYVLAFWLAVSLLSLGASRRWVLAASVIGPAIIAALTLLAVATRVDDLFVSNRLIGTVGYYNGEAAFLLVPFWAAVYLAGSRRVNPILRGLILAGTVLSVDVAVLTQSRGAMVAMAISLPVFFLISGQRLRGFFALAPVALALFITFPDLNAVYLAFLNEEPAQAALEQALPTVWLTAAGTGLYGLLWGLVDRRWRPPSSVTRVIGGIVLVSSITVLIFGAFVFTERVGDPLTWGEQRWEAFKNNDTTGQDESRYLAASGSGRYTLWQVAWEDFTAHPLLGVGTHNYEATYYQLRERSAGDVRQPHTLPLEVLSERGLVGSILFFGFLATCLGTGMVRRFAQLNSEGKAQVGAMVAAVTYWFVHSSAEWFWQLPAVTLPVIVYLALLVGPWQRVEAPPPRWPARAVGVGVAALAVAAIAPLYAADRYLAQSFTTVSTNPWVALEAVENAQRFNPVDPWLAQREGRLRELIGDWPQAEEAYREAIEENPEHFAPYALLASFYEQTGEREKALEAYRQALTLNPLDEQLNQKVPQLEASVEG
jgi:hypothetical protein